MREGTEEKIVTSVSWGIDGDIGHGIDEQPVEEAVGGRVGYD